MYSLPGYGSMISDRGRTDSYAKALEAIIRPSSAVLDIGTGTGMFALLACKFGARKVYAVEPSDVIEVAREVARINGFADRIEFIQGVSTKIDLPEKVDVIVGDIRGISPLFQGSVGALIDARERLLAPGGRMIPASDTIWAALVNAPKSYEESIAPWLDNPYGVDLSPISKYVLNTYGKVRLTTSSYVAEPQRWIKLDYGTIDTPNASGRLRWTVTNPGTVHGVAVWFDSESGEGFGFSNSPASERHIYGQQFFPFAEAVSLQAGDIVELKLSADVVREDYVWRWDTTIIAGDGSAKAEYRQSSLAGAIVSPAQLRKRGQSFVAQLSDDARVDKFILERMGQSQTLGEIARELASAFPRRFGDWQSALARVADLSAKYAV
ncbi:MAG: 50S ribosomal protein L11 methyltransferase [Candidatus Binatus sp.]|uniref:50S ribosomal protein L11 methyltransferase n=1 Tax=Candidatus Binatus sp. TaxID=2811406 RepID=UPI00272782EE|nr:50S ribosomal protein L11 methyltransferase [Candidatus Binatus sp.]MDO8432471.1 50S ribosomal protein L11 methyltransferase [Candidatus Binatus sp.]